MDKIWLFKLERGKVMKYKKLKRALALTVAVLMAVPTVNYGGMAEVHAEESQSKKMISRFDKLEPVTFAAWTEEPFITDYLNLWSDYKEYLYAYAVENETSTQEYIVETDSADQTAVYSNQEEEQIEEEPTVEDAEQVEEESAIEDAKQVEEEPTEENTEQTEESAVENAEEAQPEKSTEPVEEQSVENTDEAGEAEKENLTVSSIVGMVRQAFQPMVVHAQESNAKEQQVQMHVKEWKVVTSNIANDGTGTYTYKPVLTDQDYEYYTINDSVLPELTVKLVEEDSYDIFWDNNVTNEGFEKTYDRLSVKSNHHEIIHDFDGVDIYVDGVHVENGMKFDKTGDVTATATYYGHQIASRTIHIIPERDAYTVNHENEWTNQEVVLQTYEGYEFIQGEDDDEEYSTQLTADVDDGKWETGVIEFSLYKDMKEDGSFVTSNKISTNYKIDKAIPTGIITVGGTTWNQAFSGSYPNRQGMQVDGSATATLTAADEGSGVAAIQYQVFNNYPASNASAIEQAASANGGWKTYTGAIPMNASGNTIICAKITDKARNVRYIASDRMYTGATDPGTTDASTSGTTEPATPSNPGTTTPGTTDNGTVTPSQPELNVSVSGIKAQTYTGKAITPKIVVKDNASKKKLKQGKQYTVSYENNVNAGTGTIVLTGINGYEGVKRVDFTIQPQNIAKKIKAKVNGKKFRYAGTALTPGVTVTYGKMVLVEGTDYEISYADNNSKGTAKIYLKGNGNYTGTRTVKFKITGPQMKEAEVTLSASSAVYGSADSRPGVTAVYNGKTLTEGTDYTVKYPKTWKPGKNTITIQGKGSFSGSVKRAFTIEKAPMDKVTVSAKSTWQATGKKLSIVPDSVTLNGAALVLNKDYTVKYRSASTGKAVSAVKTTGAYQMVLTGKGCYQGTKIVDFTVTDGTAVDNTNPSAPATTPEIKPEAKPETKPETTVTGVGAVVDGLQLVESDIEGTFSTGDHIGQKVKLTATLSELENREESLKAFEQEVPWMMDVEECTDTDLSHYDIHCVATNIEGITDATQFTLKLKIDGVTKDSVVYGLNKYNNDDYDGLLGITCYDGYVAVRSSYKHFFNPKEIYIMVKK